MQGGARFFRFLASNQCSFRAKFANICSFSELNKQTTFHDQVTSDDWRLPLTSRRRLTTTGFNRMAAAASGAAGKKVYVTRLVPSPGVEALKEAGCLVTQWESDAPVGRAELLAGVRGVDALFCLLTDKIDDEVLDSAGTILYLK